MTEVTRPLAQRRGFNDAAIVAEWRMVVGERLAAATVPERVTFPPRQRSGGTLRLIVGNGGLALEIQHLAPQIIDRINTYFGCPAVARLHLVQAPIPAAQRRPGSPPRALSAAEEQGLSASLADVADPELRESLTALGRAVIGRTPAT